ncbi:hypothetical protein ACWDTP_36015 [Mycobacterium sp. NPDC003449]
MAALSCTVRRVLIAGGFALAALAPAVGAVPTGPPVHLADCPNGEEGDLYTGTCAPYLVPNSPATPATPAASSAPPNLCPPGVSGSECQLSTGDGTGPGQPQLPGQIAPQQPEEELQDVSTPDY